MCTVAMCSKVLLTQCFFQMVKASYVLVHLHVGLETEGFSKMLNTRTHTLADCTNPHKMANYTNPPAHAQGLKSP